MIGFNEFEVLTFDCYGTLIDWERIRVAIDAAHDWERM